MGSVSGAYLKKICTVIIENQRQALLHHKEIEGLQREYYYVVIKIGEKYAHPYRIKKIDFHRFYNKIKFNS